MFSIDLVDCFHIGKRKTFVMDGLKDRVVDLKVKDLVIKKALGEGRVLRTGWKLLRLGFYF